MPFWWKFPGYPSKHWRMVSLRDDKLGASDMFSHSSTSSKTSNDHDKMSHA
ncbi:hypothetical protein PPACK8108_LOCUS20364 [Phakopsora pachyrhizi]|uniref:Uncharacterized protein n=1 Tax=Phakopsora pachyrhizi TaxID=170000 RepID=A0AAV0BI84_PHAPC|nr:hypothetical protein PPACK8108_LOCUS20364 [Phakopsora pachyrhizi]